MQRFDKDKLHASELSPSLNVPLIIPTTVFLNLFTMAAMELDDINGALASQEVAEKKRTEEVERLDDLDKHGEEVIDYAAEKRLVRKLDFW